MKGPLTAHCIHPTAPGEKILLEKVQSENDEVIDVDHVESFSHPDYKEETWHSHDIGIIKTTHNKKFKDEFKIELKSMKLFGQASFYGCGKSDLFSNSRLRLFGENYYFRVGSILFFIGKSKIDNSNLGEFVNDLIYNKDLLFKSRYPQPKWVNLASNTWDAIYRSWQRSIGLVK